MKFKDKIKFGLRIPKSVIYSAAYRRPNVMNDENTLDYILEHNCSIARFGDGEIDLIYGAGIKFQKPNKELSKRLKQVASSNNDNCLICIPDVLYSKKELYEKLTDEFAAWWHKHIKVVRGLWYKLFRAPLYGDACISRFYIEIRDKARTENYVKKLKKLWDKKNIVFVEGGISRLGMGNDLFDNAASVRRIICPAENAFDKYDDILNTTLENTNPDDLIIIALGPTATVLSYDLSLRNRRALDLGHVDIEYEWYLMGATEKVHISGKASAEADGEFTEEESKKPTNIIAEVR